MTTGQKIAAKRRELELSQEALGDQLGVSRQTIYKWESDTSLPEIDKLVALSRLFQVPVGWLLGVEEEPPRSEPEFSPEQMKLLEEILGRYQRAEPEELTSGQRKQVEELVREREKVQEKAQEGKNAPKRGKLLCRWPWALAVLAVAAAGWSLFDRLDQLERQYNNLGNSMGSLSSSVDRQISSITSRVEEVLKAQNDLTADYDTQLLSADLRENTVSFSLRVVPKTYTAGMWVVFRAESGEEILEFPAQEGENGFAGEVTCPLTDSITLSAVFVTGDTRQTQLLEQYSDLYSLTFPGVDVRYLESTLLNLPVSEEGTAEIPECVGTVLYPPEGATAPASWSQLEVSQVREVRMGLFRNRTLVEWMEPTQKPENWDTGEGEYFRLGAMELAVEPGDELAFAALVTDQYGRQFMCVSAPSFVVLDGEITWPETSDIYLTQDPSQWEFSMP